MFSKGKLAIIFGLCIVVIAVSGYIYFSKKSKVFEPPQILKRKIQEELVSPSDKSEIKKPVEKKIEEPKEKSLTVSKVPSIKVIEKQKKNVKPSWTEKFFVTYFFIEDICKFILSFYYPANSVDNPGSKNILKLDFKVINARYGLELLGFRIQISDVKEARKRILSQLMDPDVLEAIYAKYGNLFVNELYELSKEEERVFLEGGKKVRRALSTREIKDLFNLLAGYMSQLSRILDVLANNSEIFDMTKAYINAQNESIHYNYVLNQITNKIRSLEKRGDTSDELKEAEYKRQKAVQKYKLAIQRRESIRKQILLKVKTEAKGVSLEDHEILYIVEWFYRRFSQTPNLKVLYTASDILEDLALKLKEKSKKISG